MTRPGRGALATVLAAGVFASIVACVDLFHSTDFPTLCIDDGAACTAEAAVEIEASAPVDASGPIDLCARSSDEARTLAARVCAYLGACVGTRDGTSFGDCVARATAAFDCTFNPMLRPRGPTAVLWQCLSAVGSCTDVSTCVFGSTTPRCPGGAGAPYTGCNVEGGVAVVECGADTKPLGIELCAIEARACARVDPSTAICAGLGAAACTDAGVRCQGSAAIACKTSAGISFDEGVDCAAFGDGRCVQDPAGVACAPVVPAKSCNASARVVCEPGNIASSCVGGQLVRVSCAAVGRSCDATGVSPLDPSGACRNIDASAACASTSDECISNGRLRGCERGARVEIDCANFGLGPCTTGMARPTCTP